MSDTDLYIEGERPARPSWVKRLFGLERPPGYPAFIWAERWNAPILMFLVATVVPFLGWYRPSRDIEFWILVAWFTLYLLYILLEGREILGQMEGRGSISAPQARRQVRTAQLPHIGVLLAYFVFAFAWAYYKDTPGGSPIRYARLENTILLVTLAGQMIANFVFNGIILELAKSAPRGERTEQRLPRH